MKKIHVLLADHASRVVKLTVLALAFAQMASAATTYYVTTNGTGDGSSWANAMGSIQGAIDAIDGGNHTNTVWVSNGVYQVGGITNFPAGTILTNRVAIWKAITVRSADNNPTNTIIKGAKDNGTNGPASVRCVYMTNGSTLIGFTLTNGATLPTTAVANDQYGGGVSCQSTNAIISNCVLVGNSAQYGGGAFYGALYNCTLFTNAAQIQGGGAYNNYLYTCILTNNVSHGGAAGGGGGAWYSYLINCTIVGNSADNSVGAGATGGGGSFAGNLLNCRLYNNHSTTYGGGAYAGIYSNCTFIGNVAQAGGGTIYATLYNCALISNVASSGGGLYNSRIFNCTIVGNGSIGGSPSKGGGVLIDNPSYNCIVNCIIYSNTAASGNGPNWSAPYTGVTNSCTIGGTGQVDFVTHGNITNNPMLVDMNTGNYRLSANSPCVNTGMNESWMTGSSDLDGHRRIDRLSGRVDMGAYEFIPKITLFKVH